MLTEQLETFAVTKRKHKSGIASDLELLRAETEVDSVAVQIPPLEQSVRQYIHLISSLLGREPTALASELESPMPPPVIAAGLSAGIPSELLRRRPDIQAAERGLAAATARVGVATAQLFPQVVLGGSAGVASGRGADLFDIGGSQSSSYYLVGPSINWNLFDGGRRDATIALSEAQVNAAKASYQETVLRAFREVESALIAVDRTRSRIKALKRLSAGATRSAKIARGDYERGILDQLTVLDAQRQSNRAETLLVEGETAHNVSIVALYKALGGGWQSSEPVTLEEDEK